MPYLEQATKLRIVNTEQNLDVALQQLCSFIEPTTLLVRPGGCADSLAQRDSIIRQLMSEKGFIELRVFDLVREECERHTDIGREINE